MLKLMIPVVGAVMFAAGTVFAAPAVVTGSVDPGAGTGSGSVDTDGADVSGSGSIGGGTTGTVTPPVGDPIGIGSANAGP